MRPPCSTRGVYSLYSARAGASCLFSEGNRASLRTLPLDPTVGLYLGPAFGLNMGTPRQHGASMVCKHGKTIRVFTLEGSLPDIGARARMAPTPIQRRVCPGLAYPYYPCVHVKSTVRDLGVSGSHNFRIGRVFPDWHLMYTEGETTFVRCRALVYSANPQLP